MSNTHPVDCPRTRAAAAAGDQDAFAALYAAYRHQLRQLILRRVGNRYLAEDLTQDAFVRALRAMRSGRWIEQGRPAIAFFTTIALNLVADHFKSLPARMTSAAEVDLDSDRGCLWLSESPDPAAAVASADDAAAVRGALTQLTARQRVVVELRYLEQRSVAETAAVLDLPEGAVKAAAYRAMRTLARDKDLQKQVAA